MESTILAGIFDLQLVLDKTVRQPRTVSRRVGDIAGCFRLRRLLRIRELGGHGLSSSLKPCTALRGVRISRLFLVSRRIREFTGQHSLLCDDIAGSGFQLFGGLNYYIHRGRPSNTKGHSSNNKPEGVDPSPLTTQQIRCNPPE